MEQSVDVVRDHQIFLAAQNYHDALLGYFGVSSRWAPGRFLLNDGSRVAGNLMRTQMNLGFGLGSLEGFGFFLGMNSDFVTVTAPEPPESFSPPAAGEVFTFLGLSLYDVQITYGQSTRITETTALGRDPFGNFQHTGASDEMRMRPGTPYGVEAAANGQPSDTTVLSFYENRSGGFLSLAWADVDQWEVRDTPTGPRSVYLGVEPELSALRLGVQPLKYLPEALYQTVGVPEVALRKLNAARDYYQEAKELNDIATADALSAPNLSLDDPYEFELGFDDVLEAGFRWRVVQQLSPSYAFRRAEVGYVEQFDIGSRSWLRVAAQGISYSQAGGLTHAFESYVAFAPIARVAQKGAFKLPLSVSASYSYNSPDTGTFLPIPDAHVFGVQFLLGYPETAKPLVPLVRAVEEHRAKKGNRK